MEKWTSSSLIGTRFEDNIPTDDEVQWITDGIESLAEPYRTSQLITLKEELDKIEGLSEADRLDAEETRRRELAAARSLLKDAGEFTYVGLGCVAFRSRRWSSVPRGQSWAESPGWERTSRCRARASRQLRANRRRPSCSKASRSVID